MSERLFDLSINQTNNGYKIEIYDDTGEWIAEAEGKNFGQVLRHAMYIADRVLAASAWSDYYEWAQDHTIKESQVKTEEKRYAVGSSE